MKQIGTCIITLSSLSRSRYLPGGGEPWTNCFLHNLTELLCLFFVLFTYRTRTCSPFARYPQFPVQIGSTARSTLHFSGQTRMGPVLLQSRMHYFPFFLSNNYKDEEKKKDEIIAMLGDYVGVSWTCRPTAQEPAGVHRDESHRSESGTAHFSCE